MVVLDANNIRGAVNFRLSKEKLSSLVARWASRNGLSNRVVICWDHGLAAEAHVLDGITMLGRTRRSADDLIACDVVPELYNQTNNAAALYVVTTDRGSSSVSNVLPITHVCPMVD